MDRQNAALKMSDQRIDWMLSHQGMSPWLKMALATARERHPIEVLNDLEILDHLLRTWCEAAVHLAFEDRSEGPSPK